MSENILEISDGKLYRYQEMAKISCHDCAGCSSCCENMGQSIWLDPYDVFQLTKHLGKSFEKLLEYEVEFHVESGLILPNLRMIGAHTPVCGFLDENGRCGIHVFRPGFCRLFPLGRNYEKEQLTYFVLKDACPAPNKAKVKIQKWLGIARIKDYEAFLVQWHGLTKGLRAFYAENAKEEAVIKTINMKFLQVFYLKPYICEDFYEEFSMRYAEMEDFLQTLGIHAVKGS